MVEDSKMNFNTLVLSFSLLKKHLLHFVPEKSCFFLDILVPKFPMFQELLIQLSG